MTASRLRRRSGRAALPFALLSAGVLAGAPAQAADLQGQPRLGHDCRSTIVPPDDGAYCLAGDSGTSLGFRSSLLTAIGTVETFAAISGQSSTSLTPARLVATDPRRVGQTNRVMVAGLKASLLDDRLTLTTQFGSSEYVDRSRPRAAFRDGSARRIGLNLKLIDTTRLRCSVSGDFSDVSDEFYLGPAIADSAALALPGRRLALSSALHWNGARLSASNDQYRSRLGTFTARRISVSRNGISLGVKSSSGAARVGSGSSSIVGLATNRAMTLEIDVPAVFPSFLSSESLPAALLPRSVLLAWRDGASSTLTAGASEHFERRGFEINAAWDTPVGETSIGVWRDRRLGASARLGQRDERVVNVSHIVRRGDWRFGLDAMIADHSSTRGSGLSDRTVAVGGSIAYEVANGPRLMIQLNDDRGRMATGDDSFITARRGHQLSATVDLTDYLRQRFDRPDLRLKIDYRRQLDRSTTAIGGYQQLIDRWTDGHSGEGLLLSFGMIL